MGTKPLIPAEVIATDEVLRRVLGIPEEPNFKFGFKVQIFNYQMRSRRLALGLTQEELSNKAKLSPQRSGSIEGFRAFPSASEAERLSSVLGTTQEELFPEWLRYYVVDRSSREFVSSSAELHQAVEKAPELALWKFFGQSGDNSADPFNQVEASIRARVVRKAVKKLPKLQGQAIWFRFGLDGGGFRTLDQVGQIMGGYTSQAILGLQQRALESLRRDRNLWNLLRSLPPLERSEPANRPVRHGKTLSNWSEILPNSRWFRSMNPRVSDQLDEIQDQIPIVWEGEQLTTYLNWLVKAEQQLHPQDVLDFLRILAHQLGVEESELEQAEAVLKRTISFGKP